MTSALRMGRRAAAAALAIGGAALTAPAVRAQGKFPDRPIRFLIPWPPGGALDALHRQMFEIMGKDFGQTVILENRPGARGTQAALFLIHQAKPDGYTLAHHHLSILRHPFLTKQPTWDPIDDFTYIMQVSGFTFGTAVAKTIGKGMIDLSAVTNGVILSGLVGALSCSLPPFEAAWCGAFLHGLAGSAWQKEHGDRGLLASEIADGLPDVMAALLACA